MTDDNLFDEFKRLVLKAEQEGIQDDAPLNDDDAIKAELRRQSRERLLGPADPRSDEELWAAAMKDERFRAALRGEGSDV